MEKIQIEYVWVDGFAPQQLRSRLRILYADIRRYPSLVGYMGETPRLLNDGDLSKIPIWEFDGNFTNQKVDDEPMCSLVPVKLYQDSSKYIVLCETYNLKKFPLPSNNRHDLDHMYNKNQKVNVSINQEFSFLTNIKSFSKSSYCDVYPYGKYIVDEFVEECLSMNINIENIQQTDISGKFSYTISDSNVITVSDDLWISRYILHKLCNNNKERVTLESDVISKLIGSTISLKLNINYNDKLKLCSAHENPYKVFSDILRG